MEADDYPVTAASIAAAKAAQSAERDVIRRICGVQITDDGEIVQHETADGGNRRPSTRP